MSFGLPRDVSAHSGCGLRTPGNTRSVVRVCTVLLEHCRHRVDEFASALPADEQECARRYLRREDRERFVIARTLTRRVCAAYAGREPRAVTLGRTPLGKPYLAPEGSAGQRAIEFNVSHSGNCVLIAWTEGGPVGVDVEAVEPGRRNSFAEIAKTAFSPAECAVLSSVDPEEMTATFYRIWVRKEAVLKAEGCGVGGPLQSFSVAIQIPRGIRWLEEIVLPYSTRVWSIVDFLPAPGHTASLAVPLGAVVQECTHALDPSFLSTLE